jgi:rhodanese-related sulfurtransferase
MVLIILALGAALIVSRNGETAAALTSENRAPATQIVPVEGGITYTDVNAVGLAMMLKSKDFVFINVHIPYEGEIEKTDLFIPYNELEQNLDEFPADKEAKIVLYCRTGRMSAIGARTLVKLGYMNVWNLDGGMILWEQAGYALLNKDR